MKKKIAMSDKTIKRLKELMLGPCLFSPVLLLFIFPNQGVYIDGFPNWVGLFVFMFPLFMYAGLRGNSKNLFHLCSGITSYWVGVFCVLSSPWYILLSIYSFIYVITISDSNRIYETS